MGEGGQGFGVGFVNGFLAGVFDGAAGDAGGAEAADGFFEAGVVPGAFDVEEVGRGEAGVGG